MVETSSAVDFQMLSAWLYGTADETDLQQLIDRAQRHPQVARVLQREQQIHHALAAAYAQPVELGIRLRYSVMSSIRQVRTARSRMAISWSRLKTATALVAALLLAALWWSWSQEQASAAGPILMTGTIRDAAGQSVTTGALPLYQSLTVTNDVSLHWHQDNHLQLTAGSRFSWPTTDLTQLRLDQGSAQAVIGHAPFLIQSPLMTAEVLGTRFALHHGWWGSSVRVTQGQVAVTADDRNTTLKAGAARWLFQPEARRMQEQLLQAVDTEWRPAAMQMVLDQSIFGRTQAWQGTVAVSTEGQRHHLQGSGRFLPAIPGDPSFVHIRLQLDRLEGRAGLAISGDSRRLAGASLHQDVVGTAWELDLRAWKVMAWPGDVATWLVEGHVNQQPLRFQVDSDAFSAGFVLDGDALVESFSVESSDAWPVQHIPHPDR